MFTIVSSSEVMFEFLLFPKFLIKKSLKRVRTIFNCFVFQLILFNYLFYVYAIYYKYNIFRSGQFHYQSSKNFENFLYSFNYKFVVKILLLFIGNISRWIFKRLLFNCRNHERKSSIESTSQVTAWTFPEQLYCHL